MDRKHTLREMVQIQSEFERHFSGVPGVIGIGIGKNKENGDYALMVYVADKTICKRIPKHFNDVLVSVDVTGNVQAL